MHKSAARARFNPTILFLFFELWKILQVLGCATTVMPNYRYEDGRPNGLTMCFRRNWERDKLFQSSLCRIYHSAGQGNGKFSSIVVQTNTSVYSAISVDNLRSNEVTFAFPTQMHCGQGKIFDGFNFNT